MKLIALYNTPPDPEAFERAYFETHVPLLKKVPGLTVIDVERATRTIMGDEDLYMLAVMQFTSDAALKEAMKSAEMAAAGKNLNEFAHGLVTLVYAEEARISNR